MRASVGVRYIVGPHTCGRQIAQQSCVSINITGMLRASTCRYSIWTFMMMFSVSYGTFVLAKTDYLGQLISRDYMLPRVNNNNKTYLYGAIRS